MTDFLTRIELQDGSPDDYQILDNAMVAANFSTTIRSSRGMIYKMPRSTYFSQAFNMTAAEVRNLAIAAARLTGRRYDVITMAGDAAFSLHPL